MIRRALVVAAIGLFVGPFCTLALADEGHLQLPEQIDENVELRLHSAQADIVPSEVLQVFVGSRNDCCEGKTPMAGRYLVKGLTLTFKPAFDFIEGQIYTVMSPNTDVAHHTTPGLSEFTIPQAGNVARPEVVAVYPGGEDIPANALRFYLQFSSAMKPHMSSKFVKLVDSNGTPDNAAFMVFKQELWSEDRRRLTLLMDPGRIKRGVAQNLTLGQALVEGNSYSIVIEEGWQSAHDSKVTSRFVKPFTVSAALRTLPDTRRWNIKTVRAFTYDPLRIELDRPYDRQLVQSSITVLDQHGQRIPGNVSIENNENSWRFDPGQQWLDATVQITVDTRLEDVAGNNFRELLDHTIDTDTQGMDQKNIVLKFRPLAGDAG